MLEIESLTLGYGEIIAVHELSFVVPDQMVVALLGRNGAGKTTTLKGIMGLLDGRGGEIRYNGHRLNGRSPADVARLGISYVPEGRGIFSGLTVQENMAAAAFGLGMKGKEATQEIRRRMELFPVLEKRAGQKAGTMSGGEQQMLAVARSLVARPTLLLIDEPGLGLAPIVVHLLYQHFAQLNADEGLSILLVEQYVDLALRTAAQSFVLEKGRLAYSSTSSDVALERERVAAFIS
jgi:branched-chain amino acid transport system ATP-binding protein